MSQQYRNRRRPERQPFLRDTVVNAQRAKRQRIPAQLLGGKRYRDEDL